MNPLHFPSLELCKKLTEVWFPETKHYVSDSMKTSLHAWQYVYPTIMEMIDIIPRGRWIEILQDGWFVVKQSYTDEWDESECIENELPNALAKQILWLKENNYLPTK